MNPVNFTKLTDGVRNLLASYKTTQLRALLMSHGR